MMKLFNTPIELNKSEMAWETNSLCFSAQELLALTFGAGELTNGILDPSRRTLRINPEAPNLAHSWKQKAKRPRTEVLSHPTDLMTLFEESESKTGYHLKCHTYLKEK